MKIAAMPDDRRAWHPGGTYFSSVNDFAARGDYVRINPVKHGLVKDVRDWPYSTFHDPRRREVYPADWAGSAAADRLRYDD